MSRKKHKSPDVFWNFKINPTYTVAYKTYEDYNKAWRWHPPPVRKKLTGEMSTKAANRLKTYCQWLLMISNVKEVYSVMEKKSIFFKVNFCTLTLSDDQRHSDEFIKSHMLEPFLKYVQRTYNAYSYVWKAEVQTNGRLHFHITFNKFIHWKAVRKKWNSLQQQHGYTRKHNVDNVLLDIHSEKINAVRNTKGWAYYMVKYFTKKDNFKTYCSRDCEINKNYYNKEQYTQVIAEAKKTDEAILYAFNFLSKICKLPKNIVYNQLKELPGSVWEKKRPVHGRMWAGSNNLSQTSLVINQLEDEFHLIDDLMKDKKKVKSDWKDHYNIFYYDQDYFQVFPVSIKKRIRAMINESNKKEPKQTYLEIESFNN